MTARLTGLQGDEQQLVEQLDQPLRRAVRRRVHTSAEVVEDACQHAWQAFLHTQPDRGPWLLSWLTTTAVREAWRLHATDRRALRLELLTTHGDDHDDTTGGWESFRPGPDDVTSRVEAREALRALAGLPERQRRYLAWKIAGLSYEEIAAADGGVTLTAVNRHLVRARRNVRERRDQAA